MLVRVCWATALLVLTSGCGRVGFGPGDPRPDSRMDGGRSDSSIEDSAIDRTLSDGTATVHADGSSIDAPTDGQPDATFSDAGPCGPGPLSLAITRPMDGETLFRPTGPVAIEWRSSGIVGEIDVSVVDLSDGTTYADTSLAVCTGRFVTQAIDVCNCQIELRSVSSPRVVDAIVVDIISD